MWSLGRLVLFMIGLPLATLGGFVAALFLAGPSRHHRVDSRDNQMSGIMDGREALLLWGAIVGVSMEVLLFAFF